MYSYEIYEIYCIWHWHFFTLHYTKLTSWRRSAVPATVHRQHHFSAHSLTVCSFLLSDFLLSVATPFLFGWCSYIERFMRGCSLERLGLELEAFFLNVSVSTSNVSVSSRFRRSNVSSRSHLGLSFLRLVYIELQSSN